MMIKRQLAILIKIKPLTYKIDKKSVLDQLIVILLSNCEHIQTEK
jgi:hypothetical protein